MFKNLFRPVGNLISNIRRVITAPAQLQAQQSLAQQIDVARSQGNRSIASTRPTTPAPSSGGGGGGGGGGGQTTTQQPAYDPNYNPVEEARKLIEEETRRQEEEFSRRVAEFDKNNPFRFDEVLARQSAEERFNPFYEQTLGDYLQGVRLRTERSTEDRDFVLKELTAETGEFTGRSKRLLDLATERAREGKAESGLFFSGGRLRQEGMLGVETGATLDEFLRKQGTRKGLAETETKRTLQDIGLEKQQQQRELGRFGETGEFIPGRLPEFDILQEVEDLRREERGRYELGRVEALGRAPGETQAQFEQRRQSGLSSFLG